MRTTMLQRPIILQRMAILPRIAILQRMVVVMLLLLAGSAWALPPAQDVIGDLSGAEIISSLLPLDHWFVLADSRCPSGPTDCQIRLMVTVSPGGGHPDCSVSNTSISDPNVSALYCKVVRAASFPAKAGGTTFVLAFPAPPGVAPPSKDPSFHMVDSASPCPDLDHLRTQDDVHSCFDTYKAYLDTVYHDAQLKNPALSGSFVIRLSLNKDGQVTSATADYLEGNLDTDFINDELAVVKKIRFGWGQQPMDTTYSVHFLGQ